MSGIKYLLDTNIVIGILQGDGETIALLQSISLDMTHYAVSQITRMELLSYPKLQHNEEVEIQRFLASVRVFLLCEGIENDTIHFRKKCGCKLPDALIAATAIYYHITLITLDKLLERNYKNAL